MNDEPVVTLSGPVLGLIGVLVLSILLLALTVYRLVQASHRATLRMITDNMASWRQIAAEAVIRLEDAANERRAHLGLLPFDRVAEVEPEHSSPITEGQQETADISTMRARVIAAARALGQDPARPEGL